MYMYLQSATQKVSESLQGENPDVMENETKYSGYTYILEKPQKHINLSLLETKDQIYLSLIYRHIFVMNCLYSWNGNHGFSVKTRDPIIKTYSYPTRIYNPQF